jgi:putative N6-adenine-specific DNA methylase
MDIDRRAVRASKANSEEAGVSDDIDFACVDMTSWMPGEGIPKGASGDDYGVVISNLPYGVRIGDRKANQKIYEHFARLMHKCPNWSFFLITSDKEIEKEIEKITGRKADRRRKLYNGMIETQFYQYHGARPPRKDSEA